MIQNSIENRRLRRRAGTLAGLGGAPPSQRRADSVKSYLVGEGIGSTRLTASGKGKNAPVGDNSFATGRQQNRRVEVIIENSLVSSR